MNYKIPENIEVIIFDLDDTLALEKKFAYSGFEFLENKFQLTHFAQSCKALHQNGQYQNIFNNSLLALNYHHLNSDENFIKKLIVEYRSHYPIANYCLEDDALLFLNSLKKSQARNFKLGIITDGFSISQHNKIKILGLENYFNKIIVTDDYDPSGKNIYWKPHPKAYLEMEQFFNVHSSNCLYIADNINKDFTVPLSRGWEALLISRKDKIHKELNKLEIYEIFDFYQISF